MKTSIHRGLGFGTGLAIVLLLGGCPAPAPPPTGDTVAVQEVASGFTSPLGFAIPDDGSQRKFVIDQIGLIVILDPNDNRVQTPFLDLRSRMVNLSAAYDERGLLGLAFHPNYADNGRFFVAYNAPLDPNDPNEFNSRLRLAEFAVSQNPNLADPNSERVLLQLLKPQANHNGGQLTFGPDGFLYFSIGDGGGAGDVGFGHTDAIGNGQDRTNLFGSIIRIDVDAGDPYAVPPDNPFAADPNARGEIWAYGLRNPYRFSFDQAGQNRLFAGDAGQNLMEEVDIVVRGGNYGWNIREGTLCFDPSAPADPPQNCPDVGPNGQTLIDPIIAYRHTDAQGNPAGIAVVGGYVYRGTALPNLAGQYVFGDFSRSFLQPNGAVFAARQLPDETWEMNELAIADRPNSRLNRFVLGFAQDADGELYVGTSQNLGPAGNTGVLYQIVPAP